MDVEKIELESSFGHVLKNVVGNFDFFAHSGWVIQKSVGAKITLVNQSILNCPDIVVQQEWSSDKVTVVIDDFDCTL